MNRRREAFERLGGRYEVRVLEPSPPAVSDPAHLADDPTARGEVPDGRLLVSPVTGGDLTWDDLCRRETTLYVVPWVAPPAAPIWNDQSFTGASLGYEALADAADQRTTALAFFHACSEAVQGIIG